MEHRLDFQAGNLDVLVATSAGTRGLTLTAATAVIHYDLPWTIEAVIQRTGRIMRFGSPHESVDIIFYILEGTIEERIAVHLAANGRAATLVLDTARRKMVKVGNRAKAAAGGVQGGKASVGAKGAAGKAGAKAKGKGAGAKGSADVVLEAARR